MQAALHGRGKGEESREKKLQTPLARPRSKLRRARGVTRAETVSSWRARIMLKDAHEQR